MQHSAMTNTMEAGDANTIDHSNASFWDELCGSAMARALGITDASVESLQRFDERYMSFYPYLDGYMPYSDMRGHEVLEVGLGYGTLSQRLAEAGANYTGLDIAQGPVDMVNHRLQQKELSGTAHRGSILDAPFADTTFDFVVAIGCLHHTGNLALALEEARRILRPGGKAVVMIYNAYSYRRWYKVTSPTLRYLMWDKFGFGPEPASTEYERRLHDFNASGEAAPATSFTSAAHFRRMTKDWSRVRIRRENVANEGLFRTWSRTNLLKLGPVIGLHLYCTLTK